MVKSRDNAVKWLKKAHARGNVEAETILAELKDRS
jgi:hypothetical protein